MLSYINSVTSRNNIHFKIFNILNKSSYFLFGEESLGL